MKISTAVSLFLLMVFSAAVVGVLIVRATQVDDLVKAAFLVQ